MLSKELLIGEIRKYNDPYYESFVGYPKTCQLSSEVWPIVFSTYAIDIVPQTLGVPQGEILARLNILQICSNNDYDIFIEIFTRAITQFTQMVASGMIMVFPHRLQGIPPPTPINLRPAFDAGMAGVTAKEFAEIFAEIVDTWYRTGTAVNIDTGITVFWS